MSCGTLVPIPDRHGCTPSRPFNGRVRKIRRVIGDVLGLPVGPWCGTRASGFQRMTRGAASAVLAAVALTAWLQSSDRTGSSRLPASVEIDRGREVGTAKPSFEVGAGVVTAGQPARVPSSDVEHPIALLGGGGGVSLLDAGLDVSGANGRGYRGWRSALEQLDDVLARCSAWSLDFLLDLDLGVTDDVQTASATNPPDRRPDAVLARTDVTTLAERQTPALVVAIAEERGRGAGGSETSSEKAIATAPPAAEAPRAPAGDRSHVTGDATVPARLHDSQVEFTPSRGAVAPPRPPIDAQPDPSGLPTPPVGRDRAPAFGTQRASDQRFATHSGFPPPYDCGPDCGPPRRRPDFANTTIASEEDPCDDARCDDGDSCTLDRCLGTACVHEPIPGSPAVCDVRALVMARQRLVDEAPAAAFVDAGSRFRVRLRLARALRSIDRALTRIDDAKSPGGTARSKTVTRRIAAYEERVRSREIERVLIDPVLTRALHFPVAGLAPRP
jgi:hypothetical protein